MDPKALADLASKAMAAIKDQDGDTALTLLEQLITLLMGGAPADDSASSTPDAATAEGGDAQPSAPATAANSAGLSAALAKLMGVKTEAEAVELFAHMRENVDTLRASANASDLAARRGMIAKLVQLGVETPATAWEGVPAKQVPCKRLMVESLDEMGARVAAFSRMPQRTEGVLPPVGGGAGDGGDGSREVTTVRHGKVMLTASEVEACESAGAKLEDYAANKAIREKARVGGTR